MSIELYTTLLYWGFGIAVLFGAISNASNFCTMGAVSDWVNMGDHNRMRAWVLAMATALLGVLAMEYLGVVEMGLTSSNDSASPPYRAPLFNWPRYLLGGLLFGIGMTLASGCGSKTMVRLGGGNGKSLVVLIALAGASWLMIFTSFDHWVFLRWMEPLAIDLASRGADSQEAGAVLAMLLGSDSGDALHLGIGALLAALLLYWVLRSADFRGEGLLLFAGLAIGAMVAGLWYLTAGPGGLELLEELDFADQRPYATGAQSFTFIAPTAHGAQYLLEGFSPGYLTLSLMLLLGTFAGSLLYALLSRSFRFEWFRDVGDFANHVIGGLLMGIGGVLGLGCTVGQGISGVSTLALGSILTVLAIMLGAALAMKYRYYRLLYEESSRFDAALTSLADLHLLPAGLRRLDSL